MHKWRISYTYDNPGPAGPFRGRTVQQSETKPKKGDGFYTTFGAATIQSVSKVKETI